MSNTLCVVITEVTVSIVNHVLAFITENTNVDDIRLEFCYLV
jgi:hypothetical protein